MQEILKKLAPSLRKAGFRGAGQNYRKWEGDFIFVINFQGSRGGDKFFVNLGAQPVFVPPEGNADLKNLKEYECILRRRVGKEWSWEMSDLLVGALEAELLSTQDEFFGHVQTMRASFAVDSPEVLVKKFSTGTTEARATLHLARAGIALGYPDKAVQLASRGVEISGEHATGLRSDLEALIDSLQKG